MRSLDNNPMLFVPRWRFVWDIRKSRLKDALIEEVEAKNTEQLFTLFGLANLLIAKRRLLALDTRSASRYGRNDLHRNREFVYGFHKFHRLYFSR